MKGLLLAAVAAGVLLAGGASISAADQSKESFDQVAKQACGECHAQCSLSARDCHEAACLAAGGRPGPGTCGGVEDDPQHLIAAKKCDSASDVCDKRCAATLVCQMTQ